MKSESKFWLFTFLAQTTILTSAIFFTIFVEMYAQIRITIEQEFTFKILLASKLMTLILFAGYLCFMMRMLVQPKYKYYFFLYHVYFYVTIPFDIKSRKIEERPLYLFDKKFIVFTYLVVWHLMLGMLIYSTVTDFKSTYVGLLYWRKTKLYNFHDWQLRFLLVVAIGNAILLGCLIWNLPMLYLIIIKEKESSARKLPQKASFLTLPTIMKFYDEEVEIDEE